MADSLKIRITGDDSAFLQTLHSLETSAQATLDTLKAAASAAGEAFGEALGAVAAPVALGDEGELARRAVQLAEAVTRAWSGTAAFDAPALSIAFGAIDPSALLEGVLSGLQAAFSAASETLRAAVEEGYLRPGFEGVDWEALAGQLSARMSAVGTQGAQALAATAPTLRAAAATAASGVGEAMDASGAASVAGRATADGWTSGFNSRVESMKAAARNAAKAITAAFNGAMGIASPSKVFMRAGRFTGEGFILGYEDSIREAQRTVRKLTGTLISAADFPARNVMTVKQAAHDTGGGDGLPHLNVGLYISDRKIAEATADANGRISNARAKRLAAGWGHV